MKKFALFLVSICCAAAQARAAAEWQTDLPKAMSMAKTEKKAVLLDFNGSDWCPPCMMLRSNVLNSAKFKAYADTNLVLVDVDFPQHKAQTEELKKANQQLAEKYNVDGFPTVIVLDRDGQVLDKTVGYEGQTPEEFIAHLEQLKKKEAPVNYHP